MTVYESLDKKWQRPSLIILCHDKPVEGSGQDVGKWNLGNDYIYLTDDGRDALAIDPQRIEYKQRMLNGRMRSYYVADKRTFSTSWRDLPSRSKDATGKYISEHQRRNSSIKYAAGQEMKDWYERHSGSFWMLVIYDGKLFNSSTNNKTALQQVELYNVFFEDFSITVVKRGQDHDLWNVDMSLVEV